MKSITKMLRIYARSLLNEDLYHLVIIVGFLFCLDVDCFSDTELLCTLGRNELVNLAALFKLPSRGTDRRAIINALLKSSRHPSLLDFFVPTRSVKQSRLRALYVCVLFTISQCLNLFSLANLIHLRCVFL